MQRGIRSAWPMSASGMLSSRYDLSQLSRQAADVRRQSMSRLASETVFR